MTPHLYNISFKKYSLTLLYAFLFLASITWGMEFYFEKLYGDLTRVGNFSEHDFGWRLEQPLIPIEQFKNSSLSDADILVIGDSFSAPLVWQTRLVAEHLKVATLHWQDIKKFKTYGTLQANLGTTLQTSGFKGRYVVIESVERLLQQRMKALSNETDGLIVKLNTNIASPPTRRERISLNQLNGGDWGMKTLYNMVKLALNLPDKYFKSTSAVAMKYDGCQFFSHRLCQYLLFTKDDFDKETFNSIENVLIVNKSLQAVGIQPIWLIVPDKSTVYFGYGTHNSNPYQNIWQLFAKYPELVAPDLGALFMQQSRIIKDFYMPDDAHLSTRGSLYMGDLMVKGLYNMKTNQPKPFFNNL